jgi:D-alanyl-D-alanine dipeptidase
MVSWKGKSNVANGKAAYTGILLLSLLVSPLWAADSINGSIPEQFVEIEEYIPSVLQEVRYFTTDNFVGSRIDGYQAAKIYLVKDAAEALYQVQAELGNLGLGLKIFDAYRPQRAVDHFVRWGRDLEDVKMQQLYYPRVEKANLFREGYIAERSGHSRGATVDLTLIQLESGEELDMGTAWDFFDKRSWPSSPEVTPEQRANRMMLQRTMVRYGFSPLREEWWHFTLDYEPFPATHFNFVIE